MPRSRMTHQYFDRNMCMEFPFMTRAITASRPK
jgi:hypothetical protein